MITLPHHVEFLSDAWLAEARSFLEREVTKRREQLGDKPFSISEKFSHAPPHLNFPSDMASWSLSYDERDVVIAREFNASADLVVEGDYQAALTMAQFVGLLAPGAQAAMFREAETMFGKDAVRVKGALENECASEMLLLLHDHMGRRTVENPDLAHRAERQ
jgi:hypothetical protein